MNFRAPQDAFIIKALLARPGGIVDLSNTKKETKKHRQNEEVEEYVPNKSKIRHHKVG